MIPAYRGKFLSQTLASLTLQSSQQFNVYIGNDNSPDDIESIVAPFRSKLAIVYEQFFNNLGGQNLTAHWKRCIEMTDNEEWLWLLPDDDTASPECVKAFLAAAEKDQNFNILYRFQTSHTDEENKLIKRNPVCPPKETNTDFILRKLRYQRNSSVAEYIFSKKQYTAEGGFKSLPLAWGSDDLLWVALSQENDIITLSEGEVYLRQSRYNISNSKTVSGRKFKAKYMFLWALFSDNRLMQKMERAYGISTFKKAVSDHLFFEYKSHGISFLNKNLIRYAQKNNALLGGGFLKNIYRLLRHQFS